MDYPKRRYYRELLSSLRRVQIFPRGKYNIYYTISSVARLSHYKHWKNFVTNTWLFLIGLTISPGTAMSVQCNTTNVILCAINSFMSPLIWELLYFQLWIESTSFNLWVRYFVCYFKGPLSNPIQNIMSIHWQMWFLCNIEILRALRLKSSYAFLNPPPPSPA